MYKKILCVSILAFGINSVSLADDLISSENVVDASNNSSNSGIYFGGQLGMSNLHYGPSAGYTTIPGNSVDNNKFAGRGFFGYSFSQFISAELGYDYYGSPNFKSSTGNTQSILQQGFDLVGKASLPLDYGFGLYIKGGLAWVYRGALNNNSGTFTQQNANNKITPTCSLGINYWFASNMAIDLSWTKTMTIGSLPTIDLFGIGLIYKINI